MPESEIEICSACFGKIPFAGEAALPYNGDTWLNKAVFACEYEGIIRDTLIRYKFRNKPGYARALAGLIIKSLAVFAEEPGFDLVVSVPLHKDRKRERGYNQAQLLAREIGRLTRDDGSSGSKAARSNRVKEASKLLERVRATEPQSSLDSAERHENIKGAFRITKPELIKGKKILLVDDIMTTGSTLNECAKALKEAGASYVAAAVVAAAMKN
ncbi:MAG: ComF family protein [Clostridiales bacterium]|nr:ComF family protein [Clostridiales bacterium]